MNKAQGFALLVELKLIILLLLPLLHTHKCSMDHFKQSNQGLSRIRLLIQIVQLLPVIKLEEFPPDAIHLQYTDLLQ